MSPGCHKLGRTNGAGVQRPPAPTLEVIAIDSPSYLGACTTTVSGIALIRIDGHEQGTDTASASGTHVPRWPLTCDGANPKRLRNLTEKREGDS